MFVGGRDVQMYSAPHMDVYDVRVYEYTYSVRIYCTTYSVRVYVVHCTTYSVRVCVGGMYVSMYVNSQCVSVRH